MPYKYVPFIPEPVSGQAVLANFNRVLKYKGADDITATLQRGMPLYEMEKTETVGNNTDGNLVIRGECVSTCAYLKEQGIEVDLVYIDPPFASGADYAKRVYIRRNPKVAEAIAAAEQELEVDELRTFEEKMYGDVWDKEKYLNWMYENLMAIKSIMSPIASIYVHLDYNIGHYVKVLMDEIFGEDNFRNEIVWTYTGGSAPAMDFSRKHDVIFRYAKSENVIFNQVFEEYSETTIKRFDKVDNEGNRYKLTYFNGKEHKSYMKDGKAIDDVWNISKSSDQSGDYAFSYATQKPERLLNYVIKASSNEGMLVADFFGGSGVTAAVASKLDRRFIHCDVGINSVQTTRDRLKADGAQFDMLEIKDGVALYRNPTQTMEKLKSLIPGLKDDDSLDSIWAGSISDSKLGTIPVYLPDLKDSSTKILDVVLINRIINEAIPELDAGINKVIVYFIDQREDEVSKFIEEDNTTIVGIERRDLKDVLDDVVVTDYVQFNVDDVKDNLFEGFAITIGKFASDRVMQKIIEFNAKAFQNASEKKPFKPIEISEDGLELIELIGIDCTATDGEWHSDSEIKIDKLGYVMKSGGSTGNGDKSKVFWDGTIRCERKPLRLKIRNICGDESIWAC